MLPAIIVSFLRRMWISGEKSASGERFQEIIETPRLKIKQLRRLDYFSRSASIIADTHLVGVSVGRSVAGCERTWQGQRSGNKLAGDTRRARPHRKKCHVLSLWKRIGNSSEEAIRRETKKISRTVSLWRATYKETTSACWCISASTTIASQIVKMGITFYERSIKGNRLCARCLGSVNERVEWHLATARAQTN